MIAADTSTWIAFLQGEQGEDARLLAHALGPGRSRKSAKLGWAMR